MPFERVFFNGLNARVPQNIEENLKTVRKSHGICYNQIDTKRKHDKEVQDVLYSGISVARGNDYACV